MHGNRHGDSRIEHGGRHRWHHELEQGPPERGRHHGSHHGRGGHRGFERHGMHSGRKLSSADLQLILMAMLAERPAHGYELIKSLEDHSHGLYIPSPGMIYPALTYLEEIGFAAVEMEGTKKRYTLTEAGRNDYEQHHEAAAHILSEMERIGADMARAREAMENHKTNETDIGRECETTSEELESARRELRRAQHKEAPYTGEEVTRIAEILRHAAAEIRGVLTPAG